MLSVRGAVGCRTGRKLDESVLHDLHRLGADDELSCESGGCAADGDAVAGI
jgi:hypothetical protein